jgi:hypothetical protein
MDEKRSLDFGYWVLKCPMASSFTLSFDEAVMAE